MFVLDAASLFPSRRTTQTNSQAHKHRTPQRHSHALRATRTYFAGTASASESSISASHKVLFPRADLDHDEEHAREEDGEWILYKNQKPRDRVRSVFTCQVWRWACRVHVPCACLSGV